MDESSHRIFSFHQYVVDCLSCISIDVLVDAQLTGLWVDLEERVFVLLVKTIRQRVEHRAEVWAVCICGHNLKMKTTKHAAKDPKKTKRIKTLL